MKNLKKSVVTIITLMLIISMVACSAGQTTPSAQTTASVQTSSATQSAATTQASSAAPADGKPLCKIGMFAGNDSDALSKPLYNQIKMACKAWNVQIDWVSMTGYDTDAIMSGIETMINDGVNAVYTNVFSDDMIPVIAQKCKDAGVLLGIQDNYGISHDSNAWANISKYDNVVVLGGKDEYAEGYATAKILANAGCKNIGLIASKQGTMSMNRYNGFTQAAKDTGMNILTTFEDLGKLLSPSAGHDVAASMISAYPKMDGILIGETTQYCIAGVVQAASETTGRNIKVTGVDYDTNMLDYMNKGIVPGFVTCNFGIYYYNVVELANACTGHRLYQGINELKMNYVVIDSIDKAKDLYKVWNGGNGFEYTEDQCKQMLTAINPNFNAAAFEDAVTKEDVLALAKAN